MGVSLLVIEQASPVPENMWSQSVTSRKEDMAEEARARETCDCQGGPTYLVAGKRLKCSQCGEILTYNPAKEEEDAQGADSSTEVNSNR